MTTPEMFAVGTGIVGMITGIAGMLTSLRNSYQVEDFKGLDLLMRVTNARTDLTHAAEECKALIPRAATSRQEQLAARGLSSSGMADVARRDTNRRRQDLTAALALVPPLPDNNLTIEQLGSRLTTLHELATKIKAVRAELDASLAQDRDQIEQIAERGR